MSDSIRICRTCKQALPADEAHFLRKGGGYRLDCRPCLREMAEKKGKTCRACGVVKPLSAFPSRPGSHDGVQGRCRACESEKRRLVHEADPSRRQEKDRRYREKNRAAVAVRKAEYVKRNRAKVAAYQRSWRAENAPAVKEANRAYRAAHADSLKEYIASWRAANPERLLRLGRIGSSRYRSRKRSSEGTYTAADLRGKWDMVGGRCAYCRTDLAALPPKEVHIEHKIPISKGGTNWPANLTYSCGTCNRKKGNRAAPTQGHNAD